MQLAAHAQGIAVSHEHAAPTQQREGPVDVVAAHAVEDRVESAGFGPTNHLHEILSAIVDRRCAVFGQDRVFALGSDPIHLEVGKPAEIQKRSPAPAARADDEHLVARFDFRGSMQCLVRRDVVQRYRDRFGWIEGWRNWNDLVFRKVDILGIASESSDMPPL